MVTGNLERRIVSCVEEDRISNLPEHLIDLVLERLPVDDAARTSILSKKWRYTWTKMRTLVFDEQFFEKYAKNGAFGRNGFIRIINKVMILHTGPISKFVLKIPNMNLHIFEELEQWILLLSRNGVKKLILTNSNQRYKLPSYLFFCLQLTKLHLSNCCFQPPLVFKEFLNLEDLVLTQVDFGATLFRTQISLPQLKNLCLCSCTNVHNFNVKATKLESLFVISCPNAMLLRLLDSPCLTLVQILYFEPTQDSLQVEKMNLATQLSNLSRLSYLCIDRDFLKFLGAEKIPKVLPREISSLNNLRLHFFQLGDLDQLHGALCLLRNSPKPEKLLITMVHSDMGPRVDVGPALNHLESPNCLDCTFNRLQTVEVIYLEGSKPELLFIKLLLAHSPSLEKFTIRPNGTFDALKRLKIVEDVMRFHRASPKAEVIYRNS